jgi:hypothetical protein
MNFGIIVMLGRDGSVGVFENSHVSHWMEKCLQYWQAKQFQRLLTFVRTASPYCRHVAKRESEWRAWKVMRFQWCEMLFVQVCLDRNCVLACLPGTILLLQTTGSGACSWRSKRRPLATPYPPLQQIPMLDVIEMPKLQQKFHRNGTVKRFLKFEPNAVPTQKCTFQWIFIRNQSRTETALGQNE